MREMFHSPPPIITPYTMIPFDDDSWVSPHAPDNWFELIDSKMHDNDFAVVGAPYHVNLRGNQHQWIKDQSWYTGVVDVAAQAKVEFITGGWMTLWTSLITHYGLASARHIA